MQVAINSIVENCADKSGDNLREIVVVVLDEASRLVKIPCKYIPESQTTEQQPVKKRNAFELFRKALRSYCQDHAKYFNLVVVVADTTSGVGNFAPQVGHLPAHARPFDVQTELFPVLHLPLYFDALAPTLEENLADKSRFHLQVLRRYGRPLWNQPGVTLEFVKIKLIEQLVTPEEKYLAVLGCRIPLRFTQTSLASQLVAHSTAVCTFFNKTRDVIQCQFLSEPVVAEAAVLAQLLQDLRVAVW